MATNLMFRTTFAERRCLVPADAFYKWKVEPSGKQPFAITWRDSDILAFAGLWKLWRGNAGEIIRTFAIITTDANAPTRAVHDRMPVILEPEDWAAPIRGPS